MFNEYQYTNIPYRYCSSNRNNSNCDSNCDEIQIDC